MRRTGTAVLAGVILLAVGCGGGEDAAPAPTSGDPAAGEQIFATHGCGNCHTLAAAGTDGKVGPNLDESKPSFEEAFDQVKNGGGGMPAFGKGSPISDADELTDRQVTDVAAFLVEAARG
jgi:mono/diheme cytochrome c family protein